MEQGGFGGQYETVMSSGGSCRTTGFRPAHVRFGLSLGIGLRGYHLRISR
jgi:hypothetical protein